MIRKLTFFFLLFLCSTLNSKAQLVNDNAFTSYNTSVVIDVRENDPIQSLCPYTTDYSISSGSQFAAQNGTIEVLNWDSILYTPNQGFTGLDMFYYAVAGKQDHNYACDTAVVFVTVNSTLIEDTATTCSNTPIIIDVRANDPKQTLCPFTTDYSVAAGSQFAARNGTIEVLNWDSIRYTPDPGFIGVDTFYYAVASVQDHSRACDSTKVIVNVDCINGMSAHSKPINGINIYPNPVKSDVVNVKFSGFTRSKYELQIIDFQGKIIISETANEPDHMINIKKLTHGMYYLSIKHEQNVYVEKFIKE